MKEEIKRGCWSNGQFFYEEPRINGKRYGLSKYWHSNGRFWYEIPHKNNLECGAKIKFEY